MHTQTRVSQSFSAFPLRYPKIQTSHLSPEEAVSHDKGEYIGAVFRRNLASNMLGEVEGE